MSDLPRMERAELIAIRQALDLTQVDMARLLGVNPRTYRRWEAGDMAIPGPAVLLARLLKKPQ